MPQITVEDPTGKPVVPLATAEGVLQVEATITGGDAATETTLAAVENAVDGLEAGQTSTNSKLDTLATQTDGLEGSATTTATNTGTTATNTASIASSVDGLEGSIITTDISFVSNGAAVSATVKGTAGTLYGVYAHNANASTTLFLWLSNSLSAGGTLMVAPIKLAPGAQLFIDTTYFTADGSDFSVGFTWGFSSTIATYTAHLTIADCIISGRYE